MKIAVIGNNSLSRDIVTYGSELFPQFRKADILQFVEVNLKLEQSEIAAWFNDNPEGADAVIFPLFFTDEEVPEFSTIIKCLKFYAELNHIKYIELVSSTQEVHALDLKIEEFKQSLPKLEPVAKIEPTIGFFYSYLQSDEEFYEFDID